MIRTNLAATFLTLLVATAVVSAEEQSSPTPKSFSQDELKGYLNDLNSPDNTTRIAAFETMTNSGNPELRNQALNTAFGGRDTSLREAAIRVAFRSANDFRVDLELKPDATEAAKKYLSNVRGAGRNIINHLKYDENTGKFGPENRQTVGSINGSIITFNFHGCSGTLENKAGATLENKVGTVIFVGDVQCGSFIYSGQFTLR